MFYFSILFLNSNQIYVSAQSTGLFEAYADIGNVGIVGSSVYDEVEKSYTLSGAGENMWFEKDAFHYLYKKVSGDFSLSAEIKFIGNGINPHRKAGVIIRQNLNPGSPYADAIIHGDGLTSLQYRENENDLTHEIQATVNAPKMVRITKEGNYIFMEVANEHEDFHSPGGSFRLKLTEPYYIGLGVCSHDSTVLEKAVFSNVELNEARTNIGGDAMLESTLETINIESKDRKVIYNTNEHIEAPNWSLDGTFIIFNSEGLLYRIPASGGIPEIINTGFAVKCNNDHGLSPDNKQIVISDQSQDGNSHIYILPIEGGTPKLVTKKAPSYWHGWSPDGKTLAYCAERNGQYDIYSISVDGGEETQLTNIEGLDDGPDYSPDGKYIYFNSVRTGKMQIWRMRTDGSEQTQLTNDEYNNWFAHPSPDGKWLVFVSYEKDVIGHPANKDVMLRIMAADGGEVKTLTKLFGGQGTMNVPSWSPDSKNVAFVSYRLIKE
ncbi:MAG: TolB family protein [Ignavibacteriales bacterium]|nr:TolB family protein [Ignavibacteriales bacterium]